MHTKWKQDFYADIPPIAMRAPLASVLGAVTDDTPIYYHYTDCIKAAGHACASVSSAFQMTKLALKALYGDAIPVRGDIEVTYFGERDQGANGPIGQVIQFLTGAATETGFHGLGGRYVRADRFVFLDDGEDHAGITVRYKRTDTGAQVVAVADPGALPLTAAEEEGAQYMPKVVRGSATEQEREKFYLYWQGKNRKLLLEEHPGVFTITRV